MKRITINESQLKNLIKEALTELSLQTRNNSTNKAQDINHEMWANNIDVYKGTLRDETKLGSLKNFLMYLAQQFPNNQKYASILNNFNDSIAQISSVVANIKNRDKNMTKSRKQHFLNVFISIAKKIGIYDEILKQYSHFEPTRYYDDNQYFKPTQTDILVDKINNYLRTHMQTVYVDKDGNRISYREFQSMEDWLDDDEIKEMDIHETFGGQFMELVNANMDKFTKEELQLIEYLKEERELPDEI